jgi:hypothetical protein
VVTPLIEWLKLIANEELHNGVFSFEISRVEWQGQRHRGW